MGWGKTQLLTEITPKIPKKYGRYIQPFFGGGALFFALKPSNGIIADSNPELVSYQSVADDVDWNFRSVKAVSKYRRSFLCCS